MEVPDYPGVWAVGDGAATPDPVGKPYPPTAQHAIRAGRVLAENIRAAVRGGRKKPFVFKTIGLLAAIGRRTGVARCPGSVGTAGWRGRRGRGAGRCRGSGGRV